MSGVLKAKVDGVWVPIVGSGMSAESARWNSAWGVVGVGVNTTGQSGIGATAVDLAGLTVTFTPVAGRRYRTSASYFCDVTAQTVFVALISDAASTTIQQRNQFAPAASSVCLDVSIVESGLPVAATTRKARASTTSGTASMYGNAVYPAFITVEDVGPAIYNAAPPATPASGLPPGGATGQVLTKKSTTDYDAQWTTAYTEGTWTPQVTAGTLGNSSVQNWYQLEGKWCTFSVIITFGSTFSGGANADWKFVVPFNAAYSQMFTCKLWQPNVGFDFPGIGYALGSWFQPLVPVNPNDSAVKPLRNADASGQPGTGTPTISGQYPLVPNGELLMSGTYKIA